MWQMVQKLEGRQLVKTDVEVYSLLAVPQQTWHSNRLWLCCLNVSLLEPSFAAVYQVRQKSRKEGTSNSSNYVQCYWRSLVIKFVEQNKLNFVHIGLSIVFGCWHDCCCIYRHHRGALCSCLSCWWSNWGHCVGCFCWTCSCCWLYQWQCLRRLWFHKGLLVRGKQWLEVLDAVTGSSNAVGVIVGVLKK